MISETAKRYCRDDISKIENYQKAINDKTQMWVCHHRLELTLEGEFAHTSDGLKRLGMYFNRPYYELIFLTQSEHRKLHGNTEYFKQKVRDSHSHYWKNKTRSEETKRKISKSNIGKSKARKGIIRSEFGIKFIEHYGFSYSDNINLYNREIRWYKRHNKCRWEN